VKLKATRAAQKAHTRAKLLQVARRVFARQGFERSSVALVCREARVTHGALYHHFPDKDALFAAVVEQEFAAIGARVLEAANARIGWEQVEGACGAYLDACADRDVQAIVFRDGPSVLGRGRYDAIDHAANEPLVNGLLRRWMEAGLLEPQPVSFLARTLGAAFAEAGLIITEAEDPAHARARLGEVLGVWVSALKRKPAAGAPRVLATERLRLTPFSPADEASLRKLLAEPELRRDLDIWGAAEPSWIRAGIATSERRFAEGKLGLWLGLRGSKDLIGFAGFVPDHDADCQLLIAVSKQATRRGFGAEMAAAVIAEARASGLTRISTTLDERNVAASRLAARLGFVRTGSKAGPDGTVSEYTLLAR
jgi:AcrR family transcriptional regulator